MAPTKDPPSVAIYQAKQVGKKLDSRQTYNAVTDTVIGPNIRLRDNLFQGAFCFVFMVIGLAVGYFGFGGAEPMGPALIGGVLGLVAGVLISGIFLMIYRAVRHARGQHD